MLVVALLLCTSLDSWLDMNMAQAGCVGSCQATSLSVRYASAAQPAAAPTPAPTPAQRRPTAAAAANMAACTSSDARA